MIDKKTLQSNFSSKLGKLRMEKEWTQAELSEQVDLSTTIISDYESNKKCPSLYNAFKLSQALDVTIDTLCGLSEITRRELDIEKDPVGTLIGVMKIFRFHPHLSEDGSIILTMPRDCAGYSPNDILKFFKEYEMVMNFNDINGNDQEGNEMKKELLRYLHQKYMNFNLSA